MSDKSLQDTYKFIKLRLEMYAEGDYEKEIFIFSVSSYRYIMGRFKEDGIKVEFEQIGDWEYKLRKVEFNDGRYLYD